LLFLVPAITMHSLSEEFKTGTFELLKTKPITSWQIVLGKYFAILIVLLFVIVPTFIYIISIKTLSTQAGIDGGGIAGSYIGLFLLAAVFAAVSICCSSFTNNAVVGFLISAFVCLLLYVGFNALSKLPIFTGGADYYIEMLGIDFHYNSISRGVIDTRDVVYFLSIIFLSLLITVQKISKK
jgi:ABC-2 type transport system permease protein